MISAADYQAYDGIGLAQLLRDKQIGPQELLKAVLLEVARVNPSLNAVLQTLPEIALAQYQQLQLQSGPLTSSALAGVPIFVKDLLADIAGVNTTNGCRLFQHYVAQEDVELIRRYRQAGLIFLGKTATPELGLLPVTESEMSGISCNPWDIRRTCGGSSGGSAAAVAARLLPIAHGSDGGGSIRIPSSNCGVFGFKPSRGSSPCGPHFSENWQGFVVQHAITRSVRDSAAMLDIMLDGYDSGDAYHVARPVRPHLAQLEQPLPRLRIAWTDQPFTGGTLAPACKQALMHSVKLLTDLGHHVEEAHPPLSSPDELCRAMLVMACGEVAAMIDNAPLLCGRAATFRDFEPGTWALARKGHVLTAAQFAWMRDLALRQMRIMELFHQRYDVLVTPVTNALPALHGQLMPTPFECRLSRIMLGHLGWDWTLRLSKMIENNALKMMHYLGWTIPFNMSGQPAMSVPLFWTDQTQHNGPSLPVGTQLVAANGKDGLLLQLAQELEQAAPWAGRTPPAAANTHGAPPIMKAATAAPAALPVAESAAGSALNFARDSSLLPLYP